MENETSLLQCYNRSCGEKYDPNKNDEDSCCHHPGEPFFHDAYKGWSCCNKKCIDFTQFLNIKGCTLSKHSNVKLPEPVKPITSVATDEVIEVKPIKPSVMQRPPLDTPLVTLVPEIAPSLAQNIENSKNESTENVSINNTSNLENIPIGTSCKNSACKVSYEGPQTNDTSCIYHPGSPVFHEGMKFWSCCLKRTADFDVFLSQVGCQKGKHLWHKTEANPKAVQCRWDYHQTGAFMVVSIYAKQYCVKESIIKLNPIRLYCKLIFPQQSNAVFELDLELKGIVDVEGSKVSMYGTKVEVKLKKAEPGSWNRLEIPKVEKSLTKTDDEAVDNLNPQIDAVDLSSL